MDVRDIKKEGVDISHLKIGDGATAVTYMDMDGKTVCMVIM